MWAARFTEAKLVVRRVLEPGAFDIKTSSGWVTAHVGDWIVWDLNGWPYPCKPDIFAETYDPADAPDDRQARERVVEAAIDWYFQNGADPAGRLTAAVKAHLDGAKG